MNACGVNADGQRQRFRQTGSQWAQIKGGAALRFVPYGLNEIGGFAS
jgi:hypothetical protein